MHSYRRAAFQTMLHALPADIRQWLESIGPLEEVKSLFWENEILPDIPIDGWKKSKVGKHRRLTVQIGDNRYSQVFTRTTEGYVKAPRNAMYSFDPYIPPYQQFDHATLNLMSMLAGNPHDKELIRQFLCSFAEHVAGSIALLGLDCQTIQEIVERIPDMEVAE